MNEQDQDSVVASSRQGRTAKRTRKHKLDKIRVVTIREDYIKVTGSWRKALILRQFVYWSERVNDFDEFLEEEKERDPSLESVEFKNGWIYKTTEELIEEIMIDYSRMTIRRDIEELTQQGLLLQRNNPKYVYDRTIQYRVDFVRLATELRRRGYALDFKVLQDLNNTIDV